MGVEQECCCPPPFIGKLAFISKREGGARPIALLAAPARVHGRLRRDVAAAWERARPGASWRACAGKACER
eukprot:5440005-Pyramimonas_sp.AAC.1